MVERTRVVLDTNVLISALGWDGPERRLYTWCLLGDLDLFTSPALVTELVKVLSYPKLHFPEATQAGFVQDLLRVATLVDPETVPDAIPEDPADNQVLACALAAKADFLATGDQHLLSKREIIPLRICTAAELVALLGGEQ